MLSKIFDINKFKPLKLDDKYYLIRALNIKDSNDIKEKITISNNEIVKIRTDRERYIGQTKYHENSHLTLEEVCDHIKENHRLDTNCISLSINPNVSALYGRKFYNDKYVLIQVSYDDIAENKVINAGLFILEEVEKIINNMIKAKYFSKVTLQSLTKIDKISHKQELDEFMFKLKKEANFYLCTSNSSIKYLDMTNEQILAKNKVIAKLSIIDKKIISNMSNIELINTINLAFSSLEFIHYKEISKEKITTLSNGMIDILSILWQLPPDTPNLDDVKIIVLKYILSKNAIDINFKYEDYNDYFNEEEFNKKVFYLAKSKLRAINATNYLKLIAGNNYQNIYQLLENKTYGIEPVIFSDVDNKKIKVNNYVYMNFPLSDKYIFDVLDKMDRKELEKIILNPKTIKKLKLHNK